MGLFTAGAIAGSFSAGAVTPCDVIKTRLQVVGGSDRYKGAFPSPTAASPAPRHSAVTVTRVGSLPCLTSTSLLVLTAPHLTAGIGDAFTKILREEGPGAFAKGLVPRMLVQVSAAAMVVTLETKRATPAYT